jgi:hypothetical protein
MRPPLGKMNTRTTPGLSFGLYRTDTSVLSFQAGLRSPGASFADSLGSFEVRRAASLDFRGLAGRNVVVVAMEGFVENLLCLLEMRLAPILDIIRKNAKHASLKAVDASRKCPA